MLSLKECAYVTAIVTVCFLAYVFKAALFLNGTYGEIVAAYILITFLLYIGTFLFFAFLKMKCGAFEKKPEINVFLTIKKLKNFSEMAYVTVAIFFVMNLFDILNLNFLFDISQNPMSVFTDYRVWETVLAVAVLIYGFHCYTVYAKENKTYSVISFEEMTKKPQSVFSVIKQYPTAEEYETTGSAAPKSAEPKPKGKNTAQDRFIEENSVSNEEVNRQLRGAAEVKRRDFDKVPLDIMGFSNAPKNAPRKSKECPVCGTMNTSGSKECSFCGNELI